MPAIVCFAPAPLFCGCRGNNEEFLLRTAKYAEKRKWSHLLQAFKTALGKVSAVATDVVPPAAPAAAAPPAEAAAGGAAPMETGEATPKEGKKGKKDRKGKAAEDAAAAVASPASAGPEGPAPKKRKTGGADCAVLGEQLRAEWRAFASELATAERAAAVADGGFAFSFVEGKLVQALREGWWLLLDEINLVGAIMGRFPEDVAPV